MENPTIIDTAVPHWDLTHLYASANDPRIEADIADAAKRAEAFATRYKGHISTLTLTAPEFADALREYEAIFQKSGKPSAYAGLQFAADTKAENGAFMQKIREQTTAAALPLLFFDLEIMECDGEALAPFLIDSNLAAYRHHITTTRARTAFKLSLPEEKILEEQANTGRRAFARLFEETIATLRFHVEGTEEALTLSQCLNLQYDADRSIRKASADAVTLGLQPHLRLLAYIFNTIIQDKAVEDRLRGHNFAEEERHLDNELDNNVVEAAVTIAEEGYPLVSRFYKAKAKLLGLETLAHYDRYAPITSESTAVPFTEARDSCLSAFAAFDLKYADIAREFFDQNWIDAAPAENKRGGAFCSSVTPDTHPYILQNYLGKTGDVKTLAHELGHGIHASVSRRQGLLSFYPTLPMAEVASTFAEMLVFDARMASASPSEKASLAAAQIEASFATIFRQAALYRFEQSLHKHRRESGELPVEKFGELWQTHIGAMFGDSVVLEPGHSVWWSYVSHFIGSPFYVYAYTFGEMLALALYRKYKEMGSAFVPLYMELLAKGSSESPHDLIAPMGINLSDGDFWRGALDVLADEVAAFESLIA